MRHLTKLTLLLLFSISILPLQSQWLWDFGITVGTSNYMGDIGGKEKTRRDFIADVKLAKTRWNFGGFARYKYRPNLSVKVALDYLRLEGDDKLSSNPGRVYRNFNFKNDIYDLALTAEYFFYENNDLGNTYRYRNGFRAYIFAGVGGFYSNPQTLYKDSWVGLSQYQTEGVSYGSIFLNIPMGIGFYFTFNKKHRFGFEMNYRKTFTDYIDDISTNYAPANPGLGMPDDFYLRNQDGTMDVNTMSDDPGAASSHTWSAKRGDSQHKDSYVTLSFNYSYVLRGNSSFYRVRNSGFFSKKRKMRRIRAKF